MVAEVAAADEPLVVLFDHDAGGEPDQGAVVGEDAHDVGASTDLTVDPLERFNREVGRRTDVVGIFPNDRALIRLAASVVIEQNDEWLVGRRYLSAHSLETVLDQEEKADNDREEARELTTA